MDSLSIADARRLALTAQGFGDPAPAGRVDARHVRRVLSRVGLFQVDSVNVLVRSHYLPLFSRLGIYDRALLDRLAYRDRELFEYWGHEASLLPVALHPFLRWKMARGVLRDEAWNRVVRIGRERREYVEAIYEEVVERGALSAAQLTDPGTRTGPWWGWAEGRWALEWLYWAGRLAVVRRPSFERVYDLPERVLPPAVLALPTPSEDEARRELLRIAARALGVATVSDLCDYWRLSVPRSRDAIAALVEEGTLIGVAVEAWKKPAFRYPSARARRSVAPPALLSPFDSLVWNRERVERLFGFRYRLEIFTPAPKRVYGYYVLPFLYDNRLVARVDLKAARQQSALDVQAAYVEDGADTSGVAGALAVELRRLATWLGLERVRVTRRGNLADTLTASMEGAAVSTAAPASHT